MPDDPLTDPVLLDAAASRGHGAANARTVLVAGDAAKAIVRLGADIDADLVVVGGTRRLLPAALVAKTRRWVEGHASCPVLAIKSRPTCPPSPGA
jgi:nucleotide-binding universal stress UspA family protein